MISYFSFLNALNLCVLFLHFPLQPYLFFLCCWRFADIQRNKIASLIKRRKTIFKSCHCGKMFSEMKHQGLQLWPLCYFSDRFGILVTVKKWPLKLPCQAGNKMTFWENQTLSFPALFFPPVIRLAIIGDCLCYYQHPSHLCGGTAVAKWSHPLSIAPGGRFTRTPHSQQLQFPFVNVRIFGNCQFCFQGPCLASSPCTSSGCSIICYEKP